MDDGVAKEVMIGEKLGNRFFYVYFKMCEGNSGPVRTTYVHIWHPEGYRLIK